MNMCKWLLSCLLPPLLMACSKSAVPVLEPFGEPPPVNFTIAPFQASRLIVIDPGHGGKDLGSETAKVTTEKELNLKTSQCVTGYLRQSGFPVTMTRNDDRFVSLHARSHLANQQEALLFVSVHHNSAPNPSAEGIEVFYYRSDRNQARTRASKLLAQKVLNRVISETGARSRGVKEGNLAVIRDTDMPAILIECGFLTNVKERSRILDPTYRKQIAKGIALGVKDYLSDSK
jgi:N-acetylmuramoyl-L-alanine amidase